jgi:S1-C subfamily serine protease
MNATQEVPAGQGTGFVWDDEGHVVTNYHVIQGAINKVTAVAGRGRWWWRAGAA